MMQLRKFTRADDRVRTGDLNLGKVPRYQLRYVRISIHLPFGGIKRANLAHETDKRQSVCQRDY
jgi:hypothetical protein